MKLSSPMSRWHWVFVSGTALVAPLALALSVSAQSCPPQPCPSPQAATSAAAEPNQAQPNQAQPNPETSQNNAEQNPSPERGAAIGGETLAQALISGGGVSATTGVGGVGFTATPLPVILPGLFTATMGESARPTDRIFTDYGYYSGFQVTSPLGGTVPGFNLNYWDFGVEKTFFDGRASIVVRVPLLDATDNSSGVPIDGFGDITAGLKVALWENCDTGSTVSGGLLVATPTGRNERFPTETIIGPAGPTVVTTTVNPTYLQPFVAGVAVADRVYVQDFFGVVIPTDGRVSTFLNNDLSVGFRLYRSDCADRLLSSITPTIDVQTLIPVNHVGRPAGFTSPGGTVPPEITNGDFGFSDQLFLTEGAQFGIRDRAAVSFGIVEPLMGPKAFSIGVVTSFNLFF